MAKTIKVDKDGFVVLSDFSEWLDISKVKFYKLKANKDKTLHLTFYDNKRKKMKLYERE